MGRIDRDRVDYLQLDHVFETLAHPDAPPRLTRVLGGIIEAINDDRTPEAEVSDRNFIVDESVLRTDCADGDNCYFVVVARRNVVWANPQNAKDTQPIILEFHQDGVGGRTLTLGSKFRLGDDVTTADPSTDPFSITMYGAIYVEPYDIFLLVSKVRGYIP